MNDSCESLLADRQTANDAAAGLVRSWTAGDRQNVRVRKLDQGRPAPDRMAVWAGTLLLRGVIDKADEAVGAS